MASFFREPPPQKTGATQPGQDWLSRFSAFIYSLFPVSIANGGTGQTSPQSAINALTQVSAATSGYVLTKDPANGNADWQPGGGGSGLVNSVTSTDVAITIAPTTGAVLVHGNNMVGDSGAGGTHGLVPAPGAGDAAANKFLKADATWEVAGSGSVTSVGLAAPVEFTVSGSPVTTSGTLTFTKSNETAHTVWAGPTSGVPAQPTFRALVSGDLPAGTGTVTSVGLSLPAELTVSGSPVTTAGTLTAVWASETQHFVFAAPSGSSGTPAFRALVAGDIPALPYSLSPLTTKGDVWGFSSVDARIPVGSNAQVLTADSTQTLGVKWATPTTGTVTSIATTAPITGGTITTTGTIAVSTMTGDSGAGGATGVVPAPSAGDAAAGKFLKADATWATVPASAGGALTLISKITTSGSQATATFSSIPSSYTHLKIIVSGRDTGAVAGSLMRLKINGDATAANYSERQQMAGTGTSSAITVAASSTAGSQIGYLPGVNYVSACGITEILIPMYAATTFQKTALATSIEINGTTSGLIQLGVLSFTWFSTAAITSLTFTPGSTAFVDGSVLSLYGMS